MFLLSLWISCLLIMKKVGRLKVHDEGYPYPEENIVTENLGRDQ